MKNIKNKKIESIIYRNISEIIFLNRNNYLLNIIKIKSCKENKLVKIYINLLVNRDTKNLMSYLTKILYFYKKILYKKLKNNFSKFPKIKFIIQ